MRKIKSWVVALLIAFYSVFFFVNDFGLIDIQKSAIVLGIGIDKEENDFIITAQLAVPQNSDQGRETNSVEVTGKGKTVGEALTVINATTGWYPKLTFLGLIVLGSSLTDGDVYAGLDYFLRNDNVSDHAMVITTDISAKEFLSAKTPTQDIGTLAIEKVLSREGMVAGVVLPMNLKAFSIGYFGESHSGYLPLVKKIEQGENSDQTDGKEQEPKQKQFLFDATGTALFYRGKQVGLLSPVETLVFSLCSSPVRLVSFPVLHEGIEYTIGLRDAKTNLSVSKRNGKYSLDLDLRLKGVLVDSDVATPIVGISKTEEVKREILVSASEQLSEKLVSLISLTRDTGCDLFGARAKAKQKFPKNDLGEEFVQNLTYSVSVHIDRL